MPPVPCSIIKLMIVDDCVCLLTPFGGFGSIKISTHVDLLSFMLNKLTL